MERNWVFIRGFTRSKQHWGGFVELFENGFPRDKIHLFDIDGNGSRSKYKSPVKVGHMVECLRSQINSNGLQRPFHVFSISMGGMVAIEWMARYPHEIEKAVIVNSSIGSFSRPWARVRPSAFLPIIQSMLLSDPAAKERVMLDLTSNLYLQKEQLANIWGASGERTGLLNALRQSRAVSAYSPPHSAPHGKALLLNSIGDRLVSYRCSEDIARQWNWPLKTHPNAGHDLPLDDGAWVIRSIKEWL